MKKERDNASNVRGSAQSSVWLARAGAVFCLAVLLVGCTVNNPDEQLQVLVGAKLDPDVRLLTLRKEYAKKDVLTFRVINKSNKPITFPDTDFGVRAYKYDPDQQQWTQVEIRTQAIVPQPVTVPPYYLDFPLLTEYISGSGKIRLVALGWTDATNPEGSKIMAYADIEIK